MLNAGACSRALWLLKGRADFWVTVATSEEGQGSWMQALPALHECGCQSSGQG